MMSKKVKIILLCVSVFAIVLIGMCSKVLATTHTSYLDMLAGNTTVTGAKRNYDAGNHQISFYITQMPYGDVEMTMSLHKHGWFGSTTNVADKTVNFYSTGETYSYSMGYHEKADYHYFFSTFGASGFGSFYADPVVMGSY